MRRASRTLLIGSVVVALGSAGTVLAYAQWTVPAGRLTVTARTATMPDGVVPGVAKQGGQAVVSWSAQELVPGVRMDHYVVTAHSLGTPARPDLTRAVPASGGPTESVIFTAAQVAGGGWRWTIVPRFGSWAGVEGRPSTALTFPATTAAKADAAPAPGAPAPAAVAGTPTGTPAGEPTRTASPVPEHTTSPPARQPEQPPVADEATTPAESPPGPAEPAAGSSATADVPQQVG